MVKKYSIEFDEVTEPITELVTKFGGQPVWLAEPQWPLSRSTNEPMQFICQIALDAEIFGEMQGRMAYIFMTDDEDVDNTFDPESGENAVVIQPGHFAEPIKLLVVGSTLESGDMSHRKVEFVARLQPGEDSDFENEADRFKRMNGLGAKDIEKEYAKMESMSSNKIGGTPQFLQRDEFPDESGDWKLLLELDSNTELFYVNFGDSGIGYAFINHDGTKGKFLWQCC